MEFCVVVHCTCIVCSSGLLYIYVRRMAVKLIRKEEEERRDCEDGILYFLYFLHFHYFYFSTFTPRRHASIGFVPFVWKAFPSNGPVPFLWQT